MKSDRNSFALELRFLLILCPVFFFCDRSLGQDATLTSAVLRGHVSDVQVIPPSVEAASLARYGNQNISKFTGQPNISVPIYQIRGTAISHDISLTANVSGFKPAERAGWTGQGWTLNMGCVITRSVQGAPDLPSNYYNAQAANYAPPNAQKLFDYQNYLDQIDNGTIERQPDLYYFNIGGYSGKFKIAHDGTVNQKESSLLKIIPSNVSQDTFSFRIIDPEGTVYYFTEREQTRMTATDFGDEANLNSYNFTSAWYVSKVVNSYTKESLIFDYHTMTVEEELARGNNSIFSITVPVTDLRVSQCYPSNSSFSNVIIEPFTYIKKKFLKSVVLSREGNLLKRVDLNSQTGVRKDSPILEERQLKSIQVSNYLNGTIIPLRTFTFYHGYFSNLSNIGHERYRLRLDSLTESVGNERLPPYIFSYHDAWNLPPINTKGIDHWGYFNARSNSTLVPNLTLQGEYGAEMVYGGGADRSPDLAASRSTVLRSIQYPGGGRTEYEYELNEAFFQNQRVNVGGIRLSGIADFSSSNVVAGKRRFQYLSEDGNSSGFIGRMPQYVRTTTRLVHGLNINPPGSTDLCALKDKIFMTHTLYSSSIYELGSFEGSQVGYERVIEETISPSEGRVIGKTVSLYNRGWIGEEEDRSAGKLLNHKTYNISGKLVREQKFQYGVAVLATLYGYYSDARQSQSSYQYHCKKSDFEYINYSIDNGAPAGCLESRRIPTVKAAMTKAFSTQEIRLVKEDNIEYTDSSILTEEKSYTYQGFLRLLPSALTLKRSNGELLVNRKKYIADFDSGSGIRPSWVRNMYNANKLSAEVESVLLSKANESAAEQVIGANFYEYANNAPALARVFQLEKLPTGMSFVLSGIDASGNITRDSRYALEKEAGYQSNGRIRDIVAKDSSTVSYLWDSQFNEPIAINQQGDYRNLANANFETGETGGWQVDQITYSSGAFTGKRAGLLSVGSRIYKLQLRQVAVPLVLEFWKKGGSVKVVVNGSTEVVPQSVTVLQGWSSMVYSLPTGTVSVEVTGSGVTVDDLRLYQSGGTIESYGHSEKGVVSRLDANNFPATYEYDVFNRLSSVKDINQYVTEGYHYQINRPAVVGVTPGTLFFSVLKSGFFTKNNCPTNGSLPTQLEYIVSYGSYVSAISQADADNKAQADVQQNGQSYANANGKCLFYNDQQSRMFFKNDCPPDKGVGKRINYVVPAGKHSSELSKEDANAKADQDIVQNGQAYVNANGTCSCDGPDKKMVGGICETGVRVEYSSSYLGNNQWECKYRYMFSDSSYSAIYSEINSSACPQSN
ncbi:MULTISPECIES: DUF5977 domain-containing protein [unclassified Sphingobacterium]|uniref:DUF5977 domain-containing protein n=1 Tax=unclassified Sphingobacterium TaxID=2609468 RepID=UPI001046FB37|nr:MULTISPECIES: DUF5977 domain-containing protein [unclassified Sphingobacterium]MCS3556779.1 hypothetical protein [Sphingobacterium sp. JUb21]TCQ99293.1 hypothetical protein EDF66_115106 [Sphingobacterium sp. JUb20]